MLYHLAVILDILKLAERYQGCGLTDYSLSHHEVIMIDDN